MTELITKLFVELDKNRKQVLFSFIVCWALIYSTAYAIWPEFKYFELFNRIIFVITIETIMMFVSVLSIYSLRIDPKKEIDLFAPITFTTIAQDILVLIVHLGANVVNIFICEPIPLFIEITAWGVICVLMLLCLRRQTKTGGEKEKSTRNHN